MGCLKWVFLMYGIGNKRKKSLNNLWDKGRGMVLSLWGLRFKEVKTMG